MTVPTLAPYRTASGFLLPSIHSFPPFFTQQRNAVTQATSTEHWVQLILSYARHRRLFMLRVEDAADLAGEWAEVLANEPIKRRMKPDYLEAILAALVAKNAAAYEPARQTRSVLLYWRTPDEWAEIMHEWATETGLLNTILTFAEISDPEMGALESSPLLGVPVVLLKRAVGVLSRTGRAQIIEAAEGEGVRFFAGNAK